TLSRQFPSLNSTTVKPRRLAIAFNVSPASTVYSPRQVSSTVQTSGSITGIADDLGVGVGIRDSASIERGKLLRRSLSRLKFKLSGFVAEGKRAMASPIKTLTSCPADT